MGVNIAEPRQTHIQSNAEPERKPVVTVVWGGGEAIRQKRRLGGRTVGRDLLGEVQKNENQDEMLDIQKGEEAAGSKSEPRISMKAVEIERTAEDLRMTHKRDRTGPRCDERVFEN
jgi:hypothetical protein